MNGFLLYLNLTLHSIFRGSGRVPALGAQGGLNLASCNPGARRGLECEPGEQVHAGKGEIPVGRAVPVLPSTPWRTRPGQGAAVLGSSHPLARDLLSWAKT